MEPHRHTNQQRALLVVKLAEAVKVAREKANSTAVTDQKIGERIFDYLLS